MVEWNIQSRAHACQECGRGFKHRESLHTILFDERQGYHRLDVCEACWSSQYAQGANHRRGYISHWQSVFETPEAAPPEPIQKETAETLLRKLVERGDPQHAGAVFILAVMLERKRLLKVKAQAADGGNRVLIYEHAKTGEVFTVPDPNLQLAQLEAVQRDVAHLLEHGLDAAPPPAAVASRPASETASESALSSSGPPSGAGTAPEGPGSTASAREAEAAEAPAAPVTAEPEPAVPPSQPSNPA